MKEKHKLTIVSLHDAHATCSCGWSITCTGKETVEYLEGEHIRHVESYKKMRKGRNDN